MAPLSRFSHRGSDAVTAETQREAPEFEAVIFDMDGVVTRTARLHAASWKALFDEFLQRRAAAEGAPFRPFDEQADYRNYVDGKPRYEGVRSFLAARAIDLPEGSLETPVEVDTIYGLGKRKDGLFEERLKRDGVEVFQSTVALIRALRQGGTKTAVVTSSRHGREVLEVAGMTGLFDVRLDGVDADELGLRGKPKPDVFLNCAERLGVALARSVVVEDAVSGVEAGRSGGFGLVVGVDRGGNRDALAAHGADVVVEDLGELDIETLNDRFRSRQAELAWRIEQEGFSSAREHEMESIFTVGNGYLGVRGALDMPLPGSEGDLFIAGIYDRKQPGRPYSEHEFLNVDEDDYPYGELVSLPFPFRVYLAVDGEVVDLAGEQWRNQRRVLDLREGVLHAHMRFDADPDRLVSVRTRRCASAADAHLLLQEIIVRLENFSAPVELVTSLVHPGLTDHHPHLIVLEDEQRAATGLEAHRYRTKESGFEICVASRTRLLGSGKEATHWRVSANIGEVLVFQRFVTVYTSRDEADPHAAATTRLAGLTWEDFASAFEAHAERWQEIWGRADVRIAGSTAAEQALHFNAYHLYGAANRDPEVSVGGRALSGRAYEGHVFWDVEIFMLPFYLHTCPEVARSLLLYRHHTLDGARRRARGFGCRGACYAWESTVTGDDVTPRKIMLRTTGREIPIFTGTEQIHVTADVAFGVWRYWDATQDREFLRDAGVEILVETARFWTSRCAHDGPHYHLRGVVGPDEYHHTVNDNAYTNWMVRFNLEKAVWAARWLEGEYPEASATLAERLDLAAEEIEGWAAVADALYCPQPNGEGVIEQFEGFFDLDEYPLRDEERFRAPVSRLFDWNKLNRLRLIKQADVLMLLHLFPERFSRKVLEANYRYYEPLTDHGSSLSPAIHAAVAARLDLREDAERYWRQSLWFDLSNVMGNSTLGVHPACMGGTWQALVFGFLGVRFTDQGPAPDPRAGARLPEKWRSVALRLAWRGDRYPVKVSR
jgi:alpha,alpha-trehalose phosphorylase